MGSKRGLSAELSLGVPQVVEYLRKLADSMEQGRIYVEHGAEVVSLNPIGVVEVEVEARQKKEKERLSIQLSWRSAAEPTQEGTRTFKISAGETPETS